MPHDDTPTNALIDARSMVAMRERDAIANAHQLERDARRAHYDGALASQPITLALRALRVPPSPTMNATTFARAIRVHHDWSGGTCDEHGKPYVGRYKCNVCDPSRNAYETRAPNLASHKTADHSCHNALVKCSHKW